MLPEIWFSQSVLTLRMRSDTHLAWLLYRNSMTRKMRAQCPAPFKVEVLSQSVKAVSTQEADYLGVKRTYALVREVLLWGKSTPLMYARSLFPDAFLVGRAAQIRFLGRRPLGEVLFNEHQLNRSKFGFAHLNASSAYRGVVNQRFADAPWIKYPIWGRRSLFSLRRRPPMLLTELFLPPVFECS